MIRKNLLFCKLGLNDNAFDLYTKEMDHYTPQNEICPTCGAKGCCKIHGRYRRFITDRMQDQAIDHPVDIVRVRCKSCGHTHSILPDGFIPYDPYSLPFILHILMRYFSHEMTIQLICARFQISISTLYRWIHIFYRHRQEWLRILSSSSAPALGFLHDLFDIDPYSGFSKTFLEKIFCSFMQSHQNPANCLRRPPGFRFT